MTKKKCRACFPTLTGRWFKGSDREEQLVYREEGFFGFVVSIVAMETDTLVIKDYQTFKRCESDDDE